jgi:type IV pilus assembly protein PilC
MGEMGGSLTKTLSHLADILEKQASLNQKILGALAYPTIIILGTLGMASFLTLYIFPKILPILEGFHTKLPLPTRILLYLDKVLTYDWLWLGLFSLMLSMIAAFTLRNSIVRRHIENLLIRIPLFGTLYRYYALSILLRVFELLLSGGVRILPALILVRTSMPGSSYPSALLDIENHVAEGQQLSFALKRHPRLFPAVIAQMISAGEATGTLQQSLNSLAYLYENNFDNLTKNLTVLIEPVLMVFMGFIVGFVALAIITPIYGLTQSLSGTA